MNFFEQQNVARKKSLFLGMIFIFALVLIASSTSLIAYFILHLSGITPLPLKDWVVSRDCGSIFGVTLLIIAGGSFYQLLNLAKGGEAVAKMAKGRKVDMSSSEPHERIFINTVEEMSIASGTPMPTLYIMDNEQAINAFVAGYEPTECVLVITLGALNTLTRDELQGVIGHEYSHILNGDMRINVRLIAMLAGILLFGQIGQFLLRTSTHRSRFSRSRSYSTSTTKNKGSALILFIGLAMIIIGYIGLFCGRIIKAAISRQREYLADAASVQFTRNPEGIASALYKISDINDGSRLVSTFHAEDINHLCFSESIKMNLSGLLASHPPLPERISAIDKSFLVRFRARKNAQKSKGSKQEKPVSSQTTGHAGNAFDQNQLGSSFISPPPIISRAPTASPLRKKQLPVGMVSPAHLDYAITLLAGIPSSTKKLAHNPDSAKTLLMSLMINETANDLHSKALSLLSDEGKASLTAGRTSNISTLVEGITKPQRIPLIEMAIASLKSLSQEQRQCFIKDLVTLANIDSKFTFFEFSLITLVKQQLSPKHGKKIKSKYHSYKNVTKEISLIIKMFATASSQNQQAREKLYDHAMQSFSAEIKWANTPKTKAENISHALNKLRLISPLLKQPFLESCAECVLEDKAINHREYELLRLVATVIDCPMPPLLMTA
jgi:Zn-dependent protease with chaperone function